MGDRADVPVRAVITPFESRQVTWTGLPPASQGNYPHSLRKQGLT